MKLIMKLLLLPVNQQVFGTSNSWTKVSIKLYFFKYEEVLQPWNKQQILGFNKIGEKSKGHEL